MSWTALILKDVGSQHLPWCRSHTWRSSGSHSVLSTSQRMQRTDARDWGKFGYVWILKKGLILGNSNQVTLQNLMTSIAMFMENWMKPCSISVQCWLWAALQGVFAFRVFEFKREHWNKISLHRQYQGHQAAHCWMRWWVHQDLMHDWFDCLLRWTRFLVGKPCNFWGIGQGPWNTLNILLFFDNLPWGERNLRCFRLHLGCERGTMWRRCWVEPLLGKLPVGEMCIHPFQHPITSLFT